MPQPCCQPRTPLAGAPLLAEPASAVVAVVEGALVGEMGTLVQVANYTGEAGQVG